MSSYRQVFTIPASGTDSDVIVPQPGYRLLGLELPTLDSATVTLKLSSDGVTFRDAYDDGTQANKLLSTAATGDRFVTCPELLSRLTEGASLKLVAGASQSAQRLIHAVFGLAGG